MAEADVLHCQLLTVGTRTYRVQGSSASTLPHQSERGEHATGARWNADEEAAEEALLAGDSTADTIEESLIQQEGNQFVAELSCDPEVYPFIIGKEGRTRKAIEAETGAQLNIPRRQPAGPAAPTAPTAAAGAGSGRIVIRAPTRAAVSSGYVRTQLAMHNALSGRLLDYNFFLSLPLATTATARQFDAFRRAVLADPRVAGPSSGLEESVFMKPDHLHLTLVMLKLYSDEKRHQAKQVLDSLRRPVASLLGGAPLKVHLQGLEYMNDDPAAMHVLYLKVQDVGPGSRLAALCDLVVDAFGRAGLLQPQDERKVKLHATVINTRYRKRAAGSAGAGGGTSGRQQQQQQSPTQQQQQRGSSDRQPFDGRALLEEHGRLDLGIHPLQAVHLSQRGAYGPDGYYLCAKKLDLTPGPPAGVAAGAAAVEEEEEEDEGTGPDTTGMEERS